MWDDERKDLDAQAELISHAVMGRAFDGKDPQGFPLPRRFPPPPPGMPKRAWEQSVLESFASICDVYRKETAATGVAAFEVRDADGKLLYASSDFPSDTPAVGVCVLGPPFGDGELRTARTDNGAQMKIRSISIIALGGLLLLLVIGALLSGGAFFFRSLRRERLEARRKTDFIDNVSHELRTPLTGIRLNAELLAEGRVSDPERRGDIVDSIVFECDRLSRMIGELLDFSRLEKGRYRFNMEEFDLVEYSRSGFIGETLSGISGGKAKMRIVGGKVRVVADKSALHQIGVILVDNAVKYAGGSIEIEVDGCDVRFMDRGCGVPSGYEERIFERFYRVDDSLTRKENGSGLGLSIARALAQGMGGDLTYAHRPGGGSVFTLTLALAEKHDGGAGQ